MVQKMLSFDFIGNKKIFFAISILIIIIGIIAFVVWGIKLDTQFAGGTVVQVEMKDGKFNTNDVVQLVKDKFNKNATAFKLKSYDSGAYTLKIQISIDEGELSDTEFNNLLDELIKNDKFNVKEGTAISTERIKPSIGEEYRNNALLAVFLASLLIAFYVALRFKLMSGFVAGFTAIVALIHDVCIMITVYMLFQIPINDSFVAAMLTVVGYSINDTIIIYDRIRENISKMRKSSIEDVVNTSITQTMSRSINTVVTTLICIITLFIFSSINNIDSIKQFSFPLIIGLASGGYSSIFIASPLWVMWKKYNEKKKNVKKGKVKTA